MKSETPTLEERHALLGVAAALTAALAGREPAKFGSTSEAVVQALACYPGHGAMMLRVAQILGRLGQDVASAALLARAVDLAPPSMQAEIEMANRLEQSGDVAGACDRAWRILLANPFSVSAYLRCARLERLVGRPEQMAPLFDHLDEFESPDAKVNADWADLLWRNGRAYQSIPRFEAAYAAGYRDPSFIRDFIDLLSGETHYPRVLELPVFGDPGSDLERYSTMLRGHAKLATGVDRPALLAAAQERETSDRWLEPLGVKARIDQAIQSRQPFSMMRMGDGEARFLIRAIPELQDGLTETELKIIGNVVWTNWFGERFEEADPAALADLTSKLMWSIDTTDVLGVSGYMRLRQDTGHFGYLALQEKLLNERLANNPDVRLFNALSHYDLVQEPLSLTDLLADESFIGVISPHPDLEERLQRHLGAGTVRSYPVPGEVRLANHAAMRAEKRHFPERYLELLETIEVPFPGAVFLIGAGLLGKVYCARVKELGGIALDVGSLVDGWMGINTRPGLVDVIPTLA
jgi:hypothetical protein